MDLGIAQPQNGSASNVPPGKTLREYFITADDVQIYYENRSGYTGNLTKYVEHGYFEDGREHRRTWQIFNWLDMPSWRIWWECRIAISSLPSCFWRSTIGTMGTVMPSSAITTRRHSPCRSKPADSPTNNTTIIRDGRQWLDLKANGSASGSIVESMQSGYFKGFLFGAASGNDLQYQMIATGTRDLDGVTSNPPVLHLKFYK